jgi:hypothetical protein
MTIYDSFVQRILLQIFLDSGLAFALVLGVASFVLLLEYTSHITGTLLEVSWMDQSDTYYCLGGVTYQLLAI